MIQLESPYFDPEQIMESGQCFRWQKKDNGVYCLVAFGRYLEMTKAGNITTFYCDEKEWNGLWKTYFDIDRDYDAISQKIAGSGDAHLKEAFAIGQGIRILKQDLWEMIVSFMISQNNNIPRIRGSIEALCERAGIKCDSGDKMSGGNADVSLRPLYAFPGPGDLDTGVFDDKSLGLGYRAPFLAEMFSFAKENPGWIDNLREMNYEQAMDALIARKGIGPKVANCICLFGLGHVDAFPIDTHVKQLLARYYPGGFDFKSFEGVAGIIQQYLFYYELKNK